MDLTHQANTIATLNIFCLSNINIQDFMSTHWLFRTACPHTGYLELHVHTLVIQDCMSTHWLFRTECPHTSYVGLHVQDCNNVNYCSHLFVKCLCCAVKGRAFRLFTWMTVSPLPYIFLDMNNTIAQLINILTHSFLSTFTHFMDIIMSFLFFMSFIFTFIYNYIYIQ